MPELNVTAQQLDNIFPAVHGTAALEKFVPALQKVDNDFAINTPQRMAMFIAQTGHESGEYTTVRENLNYSAEGLVKTFKKYFPTIAMAKSYARQPAKIANRVYANRMGNGDEASGDGWRYRGRGLIQLTGKNNYERFKAFIGATSMDAAIAYLETAEGAVVAAAWFWRENNLNTFADRGDVKGATKVINGGTNGLEHRELLYLRALREFKK